MATLIVQAIKQFADPTILVPALLSFVLLIIVVATTWRFGGWIAAALGVVVMVAGYKGMRYAACRGGLGPFVQKQCVIYSAKRDAARAAGHLAGSAVGSISSRIHLPHTGAAPTTV
jgi:hypothetical protein